MGRPKNFALRGFKDKEPKELKRASYKVELTITAALQMQRSGGFGGKARTDADKQKAFEAFASTLFHEAVHYGRNEYGTGNTNVPEGEPGKEFEKEAFGRDVMRLKKNDIEDQ